MLITSLILVNLISYMVLFKNHECSINNNSISISSILNKMFLLNTYVIVCFAAIKGLEVMIIGLILLSMFLLNIGFNKLINILNNKDTLSLKDLSLDINITMLMFVSFISLIYKLSITLV